ncbi:MAG: hypothetical protein ACI81R_003525, partial [Bradymonadia bacterium]
ERPAESPTVFLQQLGRGLRQSEGKACLTVIDFVARPHEKFRYDRRFRALLPNRTRAELRDDIEQGFPFLPQGCSIQLERQAQAIVIKSLKTAIASWSTLGDDLSADLTLDEFLRRSDTELAELYRKNKSFTELRASRGFVAEFDGKMAARLSRLLYVDDAERLSRWKQLLSVEGGRDLAFSRMLFAALGLAQLPISEANSLPARLDPSVRGEMIELIEVLRDRLRRPTYSLDAETPLRVHATYARDEVSAALGLIRKGKLLRTQAGVYRSVEHRADLLFVTLEKDETEFTPSTLYNDYVMSPRRSHWESQSVTRADSETGRRYVSPPVGWRILLFVRERRRDSRGLTMPYLLLGPVRCASVSSERPMQIVWELDRAMPDAWYGRTKMAAG